MVLVPLPAMPGFKFGCDPELFVINPDGEYVTAEGLLPGTKESPYKVNGGAIQVDGMAAEFNIDPSQSFDEFDGNIIKVMSKLKSMLPRGFKLHATPSVVFSEKSWDAAPDVAKILGCNPDFNAWTSSVNPPPDSEKTPRLRTASGHLHIGWTDDGEITDRDFVGNCLDLVKQLDWYLGAWSLLEDTDPTRRSLYGKAGACRFKPYGVEYRVLSNFWLRSRAARIQVWNRMQTAIQNMRSNFLPDAVPAHFNDLVIESINTSTLNQSLVQDFYSPIYSL